MKILAIGHSLGHYRQRRMWEWIAEEGHKVTTVVMPQYRDEVYQPIKNGSFTQHLSPPYDPQVGPDGHNYWFFPELHGIVHKLDPDVIIAVQEPWTYATYHAMTVAKMFHKPFGFFTWENIIKPWPEPWKTMESAVIKESDFAIGGNRDACDVLLKKGAYKVVNELQTGLDPDLLFPEPKLKLDDRVEPKKLLFVGRLTEAKGIRVLLQAYAKLPEGKYQLRFVGGRGELEGAIREDPNFGNGISLESWVDYSKIPRIYNWADVSIMPSLDTPRWIEQCGYAVGESLLCHVPVITSVSKSIIEIWKIPDVYFVPQGDVDMLATMIQSEQLYKPAKEGRQATIERYGVDKVGSRYLDLFSDVT